MLRQLKHSMSSFVCGSVNGKYHGYGRCQYQDGSVYAGEWKSGAVCGRGTLTTEDGHILHDGTWLNDRPVIPSKKTMDEVG